MFSALTGVFINSALIILGSIVGLFFKKGIPEKFVSAITNSLGLAVLFIGISGMLKTVDLNGQSVGADALVLIISLVLGTALGTLLDIEGGIEVLGKWAEKKFTKGDTSKSTFAQGFVNATLLFAIGAMAITGPIESALNGTHGTLIAKSLLDGVTAMIFTSSFGIGVAFSAVPIFVYEGTIALIAYFAGASFLTEQMSLSLIVSGSLLIVGIGLNMLKITKIKVANMLPAVFLAPLLTWLVSLF